MRFLLSILFANICLAGLMAQELLTDSVGRAPVATLVQGCDGGMGGIIEDPLFPSPYHNDPDTWNVHEGMNVRVGMSATVGLDKHSPHGVGLGRSIDFMYVSPIRNRWNYSIGATSTSFDWGGYKYNDIGLYGNAAYYPTDKMSLSISGYKSLLPNAKGRLPYYPGHMDSYIGGNLNLRLSRNAFLELHVGTSTWKE